MSLTQSGGYFIDAITFEAPTIPEQHVDISDARLFAGMLGRLQFPLSLVWVELWGALHARWAYMMTYRQDRRIRGRATHSGQRHTLGKT